jgi:2-keto-4-pentenoate hydratase/2-oxohepta-3-ene-1,7-dioic acid hydratase in catechol pathway
VDNSLVTRLISISRDHYNLHAVFRLARFVLIDTYVCSSSVREAGEEGEIQTSLHRQCLLTCTKIVAIGRNYSEHIKELNNARTKEPFFFLKPTTSYLPTGGKVEIPRGVVAHHEGPLRYYALVTVL